jgi:hypothetical protein
MLSVTASISDLRARAAARQRAVVNSVRNKQIPHSGWDTAAGLGCTRVAVCGALVAKIIAECTIIHGGCWLLSDGSNHV